MIARLFIQRPRLATVIAIIITVGGFIALINLPVAEFPSITPPVITVQANYPGANADVVKDTVAAPIEQEINGVEDMLYMESTCSNSGRYSLQVSFKIGSDPDIDQVNVQNRLQLAKPQLPQEVLDQGLTVQRRSTDMLGAIAFTSPGGSRERVFMSNYVNRVIKDAMTRINGVSDTHTFGGYEYSMRIWMNPDKLTALGLNAEDVIDAIRQQNVQATIGSVGTSPNVSGQKRQYTLKAKGRLTEPEEFENIIVRHNNRGGVVRVKDVAEVELGSTSYTAKSEFNNKPAVGMAVYRSSDANAMETMKRVREELERQKSLLPEDMSYAVVHDMTDYVSHTIKQIVFTLGLTFVLVVVVIFAFLQNWRATLIPATAIPMSLIGTFAVLLALGFSANTVSLFALILAIGLVVDNSIVVVENVHRLMEDENLDSKSAAFKAMNQVTGPIIGTTLVLLAVFVPVAFMPGMTGELYKQFGVTLSVSVVISAINSLTLSPALCSILLTKPKPHARGPFGWFNAFMRGSSKLYIVVVRWLVRHLAVSGLVFVIAVGSAFLIAGRIPTSFLPQEDKGVFFNNVQLPEGSSLQETQGAMADITDTLRDTKGVDNVLSISGYSLLSGQSENVGFCIVKLDPWKKRQSPNLRLTAIVNKLRQKFAATTSAIVQPVVPPPIMGLGVTGGFDFRLKALEGQSAQELRSAAMGLISAANQEPNLKRVYTTYTANTPQVQVNLQRDRIENLDISVSRVFKVLQQQLGSQYVNDFNLFGRSYQVKARAQARYRNDREDIKDLYVKNDGGRKVPLESIVSLSTIKGPRLVKRYNQATSLAIKGQAAPGYSSGEAMATMARLAREKLPKGYSFEWSAMSFQEQKASGTVVILFILALVFAYLFLVALYESWNLPMAIMLSILVATLGAFAGLWITQLPLSIYAEIGIVLLVALAAKNAILIVEFAKDHRNEGESAYQAAIEGARIRFRPVLMTALTFIIGVAPLVWSSGAGASSRQHIGTVVFSGMIAATTLGIIIVPPLYYFFQRMGEKTHAWREKHALRKSEEQ